MTVVDSFTILQIMIRALTVGFILEDYIISSIEPTVENGIQLVKKKFR